jgi:hypothetical protein
VFPGAAKTDPIDTRKILELFHLKDHLPIAKNALQKVVSTPPVNDKLKRLSRQRRQLVNEKIRVANRLQSDLQAVCPELLGITNNVSNLWFLRFLTCRDDLTQLARLQRTTLLKIPCDLKIQVECSGLAIQHSFLVNCSEKCWIARPDPILFANPIIGSVPLIG